MTPKENHLTMQQLEDLGFEVMKSKHEYFRIIQYRKKGDILVETVWRETGEFISQHFFIEKRTLSIEDMQQLDKLINK